MLLSFQEKVYIYTMQGYVIIPVYNNVSVLSDLLRSVKEQNAVIPIFVNDGSTDGSKILLEQSGYKVISHKKNRGKGAAIKSALDYLKDKKLDFVITMDGDGQHPIDLITAFLRMHESFPDHILIGQRQRQGTAMPVFRRISNSITSGLLTLRTGKKLLDSQCGLRLIPFPFYTHCCSGRDHFTFESECLIAWSDQGAKFKHVAIPTIYNQHGGSSMTHIMTTADFILLMIVSLFKNYKKWE